MCPCCDSQRSGPVYARPVFIVSDTNFFPNFFPEFIRAAGERNKREEQKGKRKSCVPFYSPFIPLVPDLFMLPSSE
jgi:hypothetical protein